MAYANPQRRQPMNATQDPWNNPVFPSIGNSAEPLSPEEAERRRQQQQNLAALAGVVVTGVAIIGFVMLVARAFR